MGYDNGTLRAGFKAVGPEFFPVGGGQIDLTSIIVTGYDKAEGSDGDVSVQTLDENGDMVDKYFWIDVVDGDDVFYGWYVDDPVEVGTVFFNPGDGLWVDAKSADFKLQTSGQVASGSTEVSLREGFKMVCNPTPVSVDLTAISVTGYDKAEGSDGDVSVQTLDENGDMVDKYFWIDVVDGDDVFYGWYVDDPVEEGTVFVGPGEALWVDAKSTAFKLNIPGVDL